MRDQQEPSQDGTKGTRDPQPATRTGMAGQALRARPAIHMLGSHLQALTETHMWEFQLRLSALK